jgi:hypothetical protein
VSRRAARGRLLLVAALLLVGLCALRLPIGGAPVFAAPPDQSSAVAASGPELVLPAAQRTIVRTLRWTPQTALVLVAAVAAWLPTGADRATPPPAPAPPLRPLPGRRRALLQVYLN